VERIKPGGYSELIEAAYHLIPPSMHPLIRPHFLCGTDPLFAGLHGTESSEDGDPRSYRDTAHVAYDFHQSVPRSRRYVTVVMPEPCSLQEMVHELGHVLDGSLGLRVETKPVTWYAKVDRLESFAEAFTAWVMPFGYRYGAAKDRLYDGDRATVALFDQLAA
jgi:hypothetical protein